MNIGLIEKNCFDWGNWWLVELRVVNTFRNCVIRKYVVNVIKLVIVMTERDLIMIAPAICVNETITKHTKHDFFQFTDYGHNE